MELEELYNRVRSILENELGPVAGRSLANIIFMSVEDEKELEAFIKGVKIYLRSTFIYSDEEINEELQREDATLDSLILFAKRIPIRQFVEALCFATSTIWASKKLKRMYFTESKDSYIW